MFKLIVLAAFIAVASAGYPVAAPLSYGHGYASAYSHAPLAYSGYAHSAYPAAYSAYSHAPAVVAHAPVVKAVIPAATSYANTYKVSHSAYPVAKVIAAPAYSHAPLAYSGYAHSGYAHAAPLVHAPVVKSYGAYPYAHAAYGHSYYH